MSFEFGDKLPRSSNLDFSAPFVVTAHQAEIIQALRRSGVISRTDIARITGWSRPKITTEVGLLIEKGFLKEVGDGISEGGRRPRLLSLNNELGFVVGIDLGATSLDIELADLCGKVVQRRTEPADVRNPPKTLLAKCSQIILEMVQAQGTRPEKVYAIGMGVPGPVEFAKGTLVAPPLMPDWEYYPIRDSFKNAFPSAMVVVDNDVNIMALGELRAGMGKGLDDFIFVKIGTGIGAGIVSNGRIHRGANGCAGDIGHICVDKQGPMCRCGNIGCLEAMAAGPAIAEFAMAAARRGDSPILVRRMEANDGILRPEDVGAALREGDRTAIEIIQSSGRMIGEVLAGLVSFFNPSHIFVGGGVINLGNQLLSSIRQAVLFRSLPLATRHLIIDYSNMGTEAGVTGAIFLTFDYLFDVSEKTR